MEKPAHEPTWLEWFIIIVFILGLIIGLFIDLLIPKAYGHDAGGWQYDGECCGNGDCEPIRSVKQIDGRYYYTTSLGSKPVVPMTKYKRSGDSRTHACIHQDILWCIYLPDGN